MYTFDSRVRYSEIDHTGNMTLPALINYFQDCSTFQSEQLGYGMDSVVKKRKKTRVFGEYWQVIVKGIRSYAKGSQSEHLLQVLKGCSETVIFI